jgi:hypothetical protein
MNDISLYYLDRNLAIVVDSKNVLSRARKMSKSISSPIRGVVMINLERWLNGSFGGPFIV